MRVNVLSPDTEFYRTQRADIEHFLNQSDAPELRPCPNCTIPCLCSSSTTCGCSCSPECAECPLYMSSEPERYPIENEIVSIVYALYTTRVCAPCWSCGGHAPETENQNPKLPRVWFYARSIVYPRLLAEYLDDLTFRKVITQAWCIRVLSWGSGLDTRFCLEPVLEPGDTVCLDTVQKEAQSIGASLHEGMRHRAEVMLKSFPVT